MNDKKVFLMVVLETVFLMLTGAIISMMITWLALQWLGDVGVNLGFSAASNFDMNGGLERLYPILEWPQYLKVTLMVLVTGILSAIYPAKKVLKQNPAEAVRRLN
jgi:ABC-type antimicrobial peptide transport system permease subunit